MKGKIKISIVISMVIFMFISIIFSSNLSIAANTTGNKATINLAPSSYKIGNFFTYRKNGVRSLDLYCAQKGSSLDSWNNYTYNEVIWDAEAGIWASSSRASNAYEKISWIKNNFWEKSNASSDNKYTTAQKVTFLKQADSSITENDVKAVFDDKNERFKLYQIITWTYTNGRESAPTSWLTGSTKKVYNAIVKLANENYSKNGSGEISIEETSKIKQESDGSYTWGLKIKNTYAYPITKEEEILLVDGKKYTDYTYSNGILKIKNVGTGTHVFSFSASTYQVSSSASIWKNSSKQNLLEITSTTKKKKTATKTTEGGTEGFFELKVKKTDEDGNGINGVTFKVNDTSYETKNDGVTNGIATVQAKKEIKKSDEKYEYTISEIKTADDFVKIQGNAKIELQSGVVESNGKLVFAITDAVFKDTGTSNMEAELENGKTVKLSLSLSTSGDLTTVLLTIPNTKRIYDLALTKTIIIPDSEIINKYDLNLDGKVSATDASAALSIYSGVASGMTFSESIENFFSSSGNNVWATTYQYYTEEALIKKFDLNGDGVYDSIDGMDGGIDILQAYASSMLGKEYDRINSINATNLNIDNVETATYNLNKTLRTVKKSDIIKYKITVYNEGDYDANNITVTDYLPEGLVVCDSKGNTELQNGTITCSHGGKDYVWQIDGKKASTTIADTIKKYEKGINLKSAEVFITCKIEESVKEGNILYNAAEIASSQPLDDEGKPISNVKDRDSDENSLSTLDNVTESYKKKFEDAVKDEDSEYVDKSEYNYQDDDDFERIVIIPDSQYDLALRKSITKIGKSESTMKKYEQTISDDDGNESVQDRLPHITSASVDKCTRTGTGAYFHGKEVIEIDSDDYVEYTIRVYNEGDDDDLSGYAKQITDYLPSGLEFYAIVNKDGKWITQENNGKFVTDKNIFGAYEATYDKTNNKLVIDCIDTPAITVKNNLSLLNNIDSTKIQSYYSNADAMNEVLYGYQEVKIICKVSNLAVANTNLTNLAEITDSVAVVDGKENEDISERDSTPESIKISDVTEKANQKVNLDTYYEDREVDDVYNSYYAGIEDDDDFETVKIKSIPGTFDLELIKYISGTKEALSGAEFTVNINDGTKDIYNKEKLVTGEDGKLTEKIVGLPIEKEGITYTITITETLAPIGYEGAGSIIFTATSEKSTDGNSFVLKTEKPTIENKKANVTITSNLIYVEAENDVMSADLALRKFITKVNDNEITDRIPDVDITPLVDGTSTTATYNHPKDPVLVANGQLVTYTIRVYNEGSIDAYASLIKDDIPDGLEFVTYTEGDGSTNDTYKWKLVDENDNEVTDVTKAKYIVTDYLARDEEEKNLLKAFDPETMDELDYRDVKVQFKVTEPTTSDRIVINQAQIAEDSDKNGNDITDRDSTPNEWKGEDDEDIEKVRVLYFDLALRKWVTQAIVTENGQTQVTETGHKAEDDPEEVVKVDLKKSKINNVTVKFKYSIRITNEGEIAGEATEIRDDVPQGLKFVAEDNPDWREENGQIVTNKLAGTTLQPGESAEVEIILTWVNSESNMGIMVNTAEINKDHNEYGAPDIDSTPGNNVPGEDDIDDAPVMLTIKTGSEIIMIATLGLGVIAIVGVGILLIKRKVLIK